MKKPRIEDFDPKATTHALKSPLEGMPIIEAPTRGTKPPVSEERKTLSPFSPALLSEQQQLTEATMIPRHHDTVIPSNHDTTTPEPISSIEEVIRKAVKQVGKEAAPYRFTEAEKQALADIEYSYKRQGIRTSGNEITRIGLNFLVEDYHRNGETSILAKILKLLNG